MSLDLDDEDAFLARIASKPSVIDAAQEEAEPEFKGIQIRRKLICEDYPTPVPYEMLPLTKRLCIVDIETDPFKYGRKPMPFWVGFYDGETFLDFWGDDAVDQFFMYMFDNYEPETLVIYAHNGGKFDFHYFLEWLDNEVDCKPFLINGRIVRIEILGQEFRDSYAIIPVAQGKFAGAKLKIDYALFERDAREQHKEAIREYARHDVLGLYDLVNDFIDRFGWRITIASTALPHLRAFHGFNEMTREQDDHARAFYSGGRVQCFETGIIDGDFIMIDRNSMYPSVMRDYEHPISCQARRQDDIDDLTDFARVEVENHGCLGEGEYLFSDYTKTSGIFNATGHEIRAGLATGTLVIKRILQAWTYEHRCRFDTFVDYFYALRQEASAKGDTTGKELYKLILNSAYGKLAQNTSRYREWLINPPVFPTPQYGEQLVFDQFIVDGVTKHKCVKSPDGWKLEQLSPRHQVWSRPKYNAGQQFLNVASAASITGAARADLWSAICASSRPLYCDTDSIICERTSVELDEKRLGAWKIEATGDAICIGGKKMYAFLSKEAPKEDSEAVQIKGQVYYVVKKAHKGVQLTGTDIADICGGKVIIHENMAPALSLNGPVKFTKRRVKMTAKGDPSPQMEMEI